MIKSVAKSSCAVLAGLCVIGTAGCSKSTNGVSVGGHVSYRGQPLSNATLTFFPQSGRPIVASITDGAYATELSPGDYTVVVVVGVELPPGYKEGNPLPPPKFELPAEYTTRGKSTLKATVAADQSQPIDFELK